MAYVQVCRTIACVLMCSVSLHRCTEPYPMVQRRYQGRYNQGTAKDYDVVIPSKVSGSGEFLSHTIPHYYKRSYYGNPEELNTDDSIHYKVAISGRDHYLELVPNYSMFSPGMVIESQKGDHFSDIIARKAPDIQCHFTGRIKDHPDSSLAISTCHGLMGHIRKKREYFLIEPDENFDPLVDQLHPHLIYKGNFENLNEEQCGTKGNIIKDITRRALRQRKTNPTFTNQSKRISNISALKDMTSLYLETLVVVDKTMLEYHIDFDVENYVLTVFNMAASLFHDASFKIPLDLVIVRMIRLENEAAEMNLAISKDAQRTLEKFSEWQAKLNPGDDSHPNHHDAAVLITRIDICSDNKSCGLLGLARVAATCDPQNQALVAEDSGLKLGYVIAHELGHSMGIPHDTLDISGCNSKFPDGSFPVMTPTISMKTYQWSRCSPLFMKMYLDAGLGKCLLDKAQDHNFNLMDILPGVMYGGEYQCRHILHKPDAILCEMGLTCSSLNCYVEKLGCIETNLPPAPGTSCGEKKWCYDGICLGVGERPNAQDGGWSPWTDWSECSRTCGAGVASAERFCISPKPTHGGKYCSGKDKKHRICSTEPCEIGQPTFRDVQCAEFNDWIYPEDGKFHTWNSYHLQNENPCTLFCINENRALASLKPKVADGTSCYHGIRDICIGGVCTEIPCDLDLESSAVEDGCGLCHGDGTACTLVEKYVVLTEKPGVKQIVSIPAGSRNIRVEETQPTRARIMVRDASGNQTYIKGAKLGMFTVPGSKAWLGIIRTAQEAVNIPGPISECISVWILTRDNVTIKYSYARQSKKRPGVYKWEYVDWTTCSAQCGPGIQVSTPRCIESTTGLVEDHYCHKLQKLVTKTRPCELSACQPRWMIGDWQNCTKGKMSRAVKCIIPIGQGEGEADIARDSRCQGPKPHESELCRTKPTRSIITPSADFKAHISEDSITRKQRSIQFELSFHTRRVRNLNRRRSQLRRTRDDNECPKIENSSTILDQGKIVEDKEDPNDFKMVIHLDSDNVGHIPKYLPQPPQENISKWTVEGSNAMNVLEAIQKHRKKEGHR